MIKTLIGLRMRELLHSLMRRTRGGGKGRGMKILMGFLLVYCVVVFGFLFGGMFFLLCEPFAQMGLSWLYFAFAGVMSAMLCFFGSIFYTQSVIFEAKDNELLLSMPIKPAAILFSRVGTIFLLNLGYSLIIAIPCMVVWVWQMGFDALLLLRMIVFMLLMPLLPTCLSCLAGWGIALISSRMRSKNIISLVLSTVLLAAYFYVCFNTQALLTKLMENGEALAAAIRKVLPPFYALGVATAEGNILQSLLWILWCVVPMAAVYALLSKSFVRIATMKRGAKKMKYKAQRMVASSARSALVRKELRRVTSNAMYIMNGAIGAIMAVILAVVMLFKRDLIDTLLAQFVMTGLNLDGWIGGIACAMLCMLMSMNVLSAPSLSVEGKNLWLMQSLPLPAGEILLAKVMMHMIICVPCGLVAGAVMGIALRADAITWLALMVLPALLTCFMAFVGVVINLHLPRFDYANDLIAVKQSAATGITMFVGMGIVALPVIVYAVIFKGKIPLGGVYLCYGILLALGCLMMYYYLSRSAQKRFDALGQG